MVNSIQRLRSVVGFEPRYDIGSGMAQTYDWWKEHRGVEGMRFEPGRLGHDVDLAREDELIAKWDKAD